MKIIATWAIVCLICVGLGYAGKLLIDREYDSPSRTVVTYTEDEMTCKVTATFPTPNSPVIMKQLNVWMASAVSHTGKLSGWMLIKFKDGSICKAHAETRKLEIVANKDENDPNQLANIKANYKVISDFIVLQAKKNKKN